MMHMCNTYTYCSVDGIVCFTFILLNFVINISSELKILKMSSWEKERPLTQKEIEEAIANLSESEDNFDESSDEDDAFIRNFPLENEIISIENVNMKQHVEIGEVFDLENIQILFADEPMQPML